MVTTVGRVGFGEVEGGFGALQLAAEEAGAPEPPRTSDVQVPASSVPVTVPCSSPTLLVSVGQSVDT